LSSFERTHRWEIRSLKEHLKSPENQAIYSVIHGGVDISLREKSINLLCSEPFDGHSIGGSLGQTKEEMIKLLRGLSVMLPRDKISFASPTPSALVSILTTQASLLSSLGTVAC
jgi:queuine tRNA-ribosyltransferase